MEDFGYSKQQEENAFANVVKKSLMLGAALFSLACFAYITINAYHYFSRNNANVETIKAEADPIKIVENSEQQNEAQDGVKIDNSIYEDIFGNRKNSKDKNVTVREAIAPAIPIAASIAKVEKIEKNEKNIAQNNSTQVQNTTQNLLQDKQVNAAKSPEKIIVYSSNTETKQDSAGAVLAQKNTAKKTPQMSPSDLAKQVAKPELIGKKYAKVQIAALTSKKSADEYWKQLQRLYPSLFSDVRSFIEQVDLGKRGIFYRLQIGNFNDQIRAEEFCNRYVAQTQKSRADCIVVE